MTKLKFVEIENYFDSAFVSDLVAHNSSSLEKLKIHQEVIRGEVCIDKALNLKELSVSLSSEGASVRVKNALSLASISSNCRVTLDENVQSLSSLTYTHGYRPNAEESRNILARAKNLAKLTFDHEKHQDQPNTIAERESRNAMLDLLGLSSPQPVTKQL